VEERIDCKELKKRKKKKKKKKEAKQTSEQTKKTGLPEYRRNGEENKFKNKRLLSIDK